MRILVTSYPAVSHLYPMVPLAWGLRAAGHEVRVAAAPSFAAAARRTGLPVLPLGEDVDGTVAWQGFDPRAGDRTERTMRMFRSTAEGWAGALVALARDWADVVLFDPREYAGPVAAAVAGIPSARVLYGVDHTYAQRAGEWPLLAPLWDEWGLGEPDPAGTVTIDPCPAALQLETPVASWPLRTIPYNGSAVIPRTAAPAGRPRVCLTWGASFGGTTGNLDPVRVALAGLLRRDVEVVVAVARGQRELLGELPAGVRVLESVPLHTILPGCALVVHQGGAGTALTAAACGVPQLVVPFKGDQVTHAGRVAAAGAGVLLPAAELTPEAVAAAAAGVFADAEYARRAAEIATENRSRPAPAAVVAQLEFLVR
ncbi:UDP:flavonoid glycosyltransferase YjiC, YdhE family [Amycolatopsis pretoriensis]|uniref:UDP:flavonoid glycosyltransferase YjiC, YdhE family n=1 Tax=Amycolatopsis pretoriensis TaxID=218821 RepID=A0A1H5QGK3_9PSEU|nr:nucleotide disphospho-sugar-binding domain-containing protein [Amycolatopsis pretoriensis]SEF24337.1 UDP:flavonoid glycosyltransferase YjiC, YdhE family [Amycolatopsis pretoriensis]